MNIRPVTRADISAIAGWIVTIPLWQRYGLTVDLLSARIEGALDTDLLLTVDADECAAAFAWCVAKGAFGRSAYLKMLGVRPDHAGQGIGARLLEHLETIIVSDDLFLLAAEFNTDAHRFYRRMGYEQIGAIPGYVLPDVSELIFRKRVR